MKKIAIYGAGGFGREISCLINIINKKKLIWDFLGFYDDGIVKGSKNEYGEILGGTRDLNKLEEELHLVIAIGSPKSRVNVSSEITNPKIFYPNIIAPGTFWLDEESVILGKGNIIANNCSFSCNIKIGDFNVFNGGVSIGHDVNISDFNAFMPGVRISGEVNIGNRNFFGVSSCVLQQLKIDQDTTVGANSLIIRKTRNGVTYVGSPAKIVQY